MKRLKAPQIETPLGNQKNLANLRLCWKKYRLEIKYQVPISQLTVGSNTSHRLTRETGFAHQLPRPLPLVAAALPFSIATTREVPTAAVWMGWIKATVSFGGVRHWCGWLHFNQLSSICSRRTLHIFLKLGDQADLEKNPCTVSLHFPSCLRHCNWSPSRDSSWRIDRGRDGQALIQIATTERDTSCTSCFVVTGQQKKH